jgi:hypothetical protein
MTKHNVRCKKEKMVNKNFVYVGVLVFASIIIVSLVSAKHSAWHFWGEEEPELAPFDASVTVSNAPPLIVAFRPVNDFNPIDPVSVDGQVQPVPGGTVEALVVFIVEDPNGPGDLPGPVGGDGAPALVAGDIAIDLTAPINGISSTVRSATATSCVPFECASGTNTNCDATTVGAGDGTDFTLQKQYSCVVVMQYFDEPALSAISAADMWAMSATIRDVGGTIDTKASGAVGFQDLTNDYIEYLTTSAVSTSGSADWTGLDVAAEDTAADAPLTLDNFGNTAVATVTVQGEDLTGVNDPTAVMQVAAFSAGASPGGANSGACDGPSGLGPGTGATELIASSPVVASGITVPFLATGTDTGSMNFCIWAAVNPGFLVPPLDVAYSATAAKGIDWEVLFNS